MENWLEMKKLVNQFQAIVICSVMLVFPTKLVRSDNLLANSMVLSETEIQTKVADLPGWIVEGQELKRSFKFKNFVEAVNLVNQLVEPSEALAHHPDLEVGYGRVDVSLTTHDAGGLTNLDFALAEKISKLLN